MSFFFEIYKLLKFLVYPLTWIILLLGTAVFFAYKGNKVYFRLCVLITLMLTYLLSISPVSRMLAWSLEGQYASPSIDSDARFDAMVALAGGVRRRGGLRVRDELSPDTLQRLICARELMQQGLTSTLVLSGGNADSQEDAMPESMVMVETLSTIGVGNWDVHVEIDSRTTYENAVEVKKLLAEKKKIALVTTALHMPRAATVFKWQGFDVTAFPCGFTAGALPEGFLKFLPDVGHLKQSTLAISEWTGFGSYWLMSKVGVYAQ